MIACLTSKIQPNQLVNDIIQSTTDNAPGDYEEF